MKKTKGSLVLLIVSMLFVFLFVFNDNLNGTITVLLNANIWYLLICIISVFVANLFRGLGYALVFKSMNVKYNYWGVFKFGMISQLFDGITPFSSGGQPYQVYFLKKNYGMGYSAATGFVFYTSLVYQIALLIISSILLLINKINNFITPDSLIWNLVIVGYVITLGFVAILFVINLDRKHGKKFLTGLINFLKKIRIIKDVMYDKFERYINNLFDSLEHLNSDNKLLMKTTFYNMLFLAGMLIIPIFAMNSVMPDIKMPIMASVIAADFVMLCALFIPIPGGTIGQEFAFISLFSVFATASVVKAGMLFWRFMSYYFVIILGFVFFLFSRRKKR
jgi:hypothetical protein